MQDLLVERVAKAICYWDDTATCRDNICVGQCRAIKPDERFFAQARAAIAATEIEHLQSQLNAATEALKLVDEAPIAEAPAGHEWCRVSMKWDWLRTVRAALKRLA